jgi:hypothetical protein
MRTQAHRIDDTDPKRGNVVVRVTGTRHDEPTYQVRQSLPNTQEVPGHDHHTNRVRETGSGSHGPILRSVPTNRLSQHLDRSSGSRQRLETNARGVRIRNVWSRYDIPWAAVRDVEIVECDTESRYNYELRFTVARDTNPGEPTAATPEGSGPDTGDPGRFSCSHMIRTTTGTGVLNMCCGICALSAWRMPWRPSSHGGG